MSPLQILPEKISNKITVVTVIGQMDESNIDIHSKSFYSVIENLPPGSILILNFSELTYMNSKAIGYTTDFSNKMTEKNGAVIIAECQENVYDVLNVVGLPTFILFESTVKSAKDKAFEITEENPEFFNNNGSQDPVQEPVAEEASSENESQEETSLPQSTETETESVTESEPVSHISETISAPVSEEPVTQTISPKETETGEESDHSALLLIALLAIGIIIIGVFL